MFMKTFEEKWTAWVDGKLTGKELVEFEASLPDRPTAEAEKRAAHKLGLLLKTELRAETMANAEFFSHQLRERIAREDAARPRGRGNLSSWWTIARLFWSGAAAIAMFLIFTVIVFRHDRYPAGQSDLTSQIMQARIDPVANPNATITVFQTKQERVTVLWTEGLKSLPAGYAAK
jgi:hypothetical protein